MAKQSIDSAHVADWPATKQQASKLITSLQASLRQLNNNKKLRSSRHGKRQTSSVAKNLGPDADCMDFTTEEIPSPTLSPRKTSKPRPLVSSIDQKARMGLCKILQACTTWQSYTEIANLIPRNEEFCIAIALNNSPERFRFRALAHLNYDKYARITGYITEIQSFKELYDPKSVFPSVISARIFFKMDPRLPVVCYICKNTFEEFSNVIWKMCGKEAMHVSCFTRKVAEGQMPLFGPCYCLGDAELIRAQD